MCLFPTLIENPKYKANKKNGWNPPPVKDQRVKYVPIGCNTCIECKKKKQRDWQVRLSEEIKAKPNGKFLTLTFTDQAIEELTLYINDGIHLDTKTGECIQVKEPLQTPLTGYDLDNAIATLAVRRFKERWRKKYGKSLRHWYITELGHEGTENIHLHGIVWCDHELADVEKYWQYGWVWKGKISAIKRGGFTRQTLVNYVNERTVGYITKYVSKQDQKHKGYKPIVLTSPGIGAAYVKQNDWHKLKYNDKKTIETYRTKTGYTIALPIYYRNKRYSEQEREQLWLQRLDKQERWVLGERIDITKSEEPYFAALPWARRTNQQLGYDNPTLRTQEQDQYEREHRKLKQLQRLERLRRAV